MYHVIIMLKVTNLSQCRDICFDVLIPEGNRTNILNLLRTATTIPAFSDTKSQGNACGEFSVKGDGFLFLFHGVSSVVKCDVKWLRLEWFGKLNFCHVVVLYT